jgi:hypothetical protein
LRRRSAASLRSEKEVVGPRLTNAMHRCFVQESRQSYQNPSAMSLQSHCHHLIVRWEFARGVLASLDPSADCLSVKWAGWRASRKSTVCAEAAVGGASTVAAAEAGRSRWSVVATWPPSSDCGRFSCLMNWESLRGALILLFPQCAASIDWLSSIGVNMLCLAEAWRGLGCGNGGLWNSLCCGGDGTLMVGWGGRSCIRGG